MFRGQRYLESEDDEQVLINYVFASPVHIFALRIDSPIGSIYFSL